MKCPDCKFENIQGAEICDNCGRDLAGLDIPGAVLDPGVSFVYEELSKLPRKPPLKVSVTDP
ncbi:MAG TPA: hypothetical protein VNN10_06875, partial [Dehalococcoidia bacterium]|nr:hypothetical protein [Dehalococcoidia bacterium]